MKYHASCSMILGKIVSSDEMMVATTRIEKIPEAKRLRYEKDKYLVTSFRVSVNFARTSN